MQERSREQDGSTGCRRSDGKWENAIKTILIYVVNKFWQAQQFVRSGEFSRALQTLGAALKSFPDDSKVCSVILEAVNQSPNCAAPFASMQTGGVVPSSNNKQAAKVQRTG